MIHEPKKYKLFCCACGDSFVAVRSDARTCSEGCRLALCMLGKAIKEHQELSPEDKQKFDESTVKMRVDGSDIIYRAKYRKDQDNTVVLPKAVTDQLSKKQLRPKKAKKVVEPKNDKNLIPGATGKEQEKLEKKEKKKNKKKGGANEAD